MSNATFMQDLMVRMEFQDNEKLVIQTPEGGLLEMVLDENKNLRLESFLRAAGDFVQSTLALIPTRPWRWTVWINIYVAFRRCEGLKVLHGDSTAKHPSYECLIGAYPRKTDSTTASPPRSGQ
ncbi:MAG: hypothetical protein AB7G93_11080 [Bdellovibrionales bacterium]